MEQETVPVTSLGVNELGRLREQLQENVEQLLESHSMLSRAVSRSEHAGRTVATLASSKPGVLLANLAPASVCWIVAASLLTGSGHHPPSLPPLLLLLLLFLLVTNVVSSHCSTVTLQTSR